MLIENSCQESHKENQGILCFFDGGLPPSLLGTIHHLWMCVPRWLIFKGHSLRPWKYKPKGKQTQSSLSRLVNQCIPPITPLLVRHKTGPADQKYKIKSNSFMILVLTVWSISCHAVSNCSTANQKYTWVSEAEFLKIPLQKPSWWLNTVSCHNYGAQQRKTIDDTVDDLKKDLFTNHSSVGWLCWQENGRFEQVIHDTTLIWVSPCHCSMHSGIGTTPPPPVQPLSVSRGYEWNLMNY